MRASDTSGATLSGWKSSVAGCVVAFTMESSGMGGGCVGICIGAGNEFQDVAGLAAERGADRLERREPDGAGLAGLEDREVGQRDVDARGQLGQGHAPVVEEVVELDGDRHVTPSLRGLRASVRLRRTRAPGRMSGSPPTSR